MTKEERDNAINDLAVHYLERLAVVPNLYADQIINGVKLGAKWSDEHPLVERELKEAYIEGYEQAIEDACKWLQDNLTYTHPRKETKTCMVNIPRFKQDLLSGELFLALADRDVNRKQ